MTKTEELKDWIKNRGYTSSIDIEKWAMASGRMSAESARVDHDR